MYITILAFGTWGDVRPYGVLGQALQANGHHVQIAASRNFEDWIRARDFDFYPLTVDVQAMMAEMMDDGLNIIDAVRVNREYIAPAMLDMGLDFLQATEGSDAMLMMQAGLAIGSGIMEHRNLKTIIVNFQPLTRTAEYSNSAFPELPAWMPLQGTFNHFTHTFVEYMMWSMYGRSHGNTIRTDHLGLDKHTWGDFRHHLATLPTLTCVSRHVMPRPSDWHANHHLTGFLFDDDPNWQAPQTLVDFLADGTPPVYIGFGSMSAKNPRKTTDILLEAVEKVGVRAILLTGWAGLDADEVSDKVYMLDYAPHSWLFPQMAAVVHHGGAGTTAAGVRAGVPSLVVPFGADQPFWGNRLYQLGVAAKPIGRKKLTSDNLAEGLRAITQSAEMQAKAKALGEVILAEDSISQALSVIEDALK